MRVPGYYVAVREAYKFGIPFGLPGAAGAALRAKPYPGTTANTRNGLPLPSTILSGAAITTAPVAGS